MLSRIDTLLRLVAVLLLASLWAAPAAAAETPWHEQAKTRLTEALARYETIAAEGGWSRVPAGPTLEPGMTDPRIEALRRRLEVTGEAPAEAAASAHFDPALEASVRRFQARHGLLDDGLVGPKTIAALNVTAEQRVATLRLNLERLRAFRPAGPSYVLVNVPGFEARLIDRDRVDLKTIVIVGKPTWRTPEASGMISRVVLNPTWTVPPSIMVRETIPKIRRDPDYLARQGFRVFDGWGTGARQLDPAGIDWSSRAVRAYRLRQDPGPRNALGQIKFLFDNPYGVYLHDTPTKSLFERADRALSHGCIRVASPLDLGTRLLAAQPGWSRQRVDAVVDSGITTEITLERPVPVHIVYWTAWVDEDGRTRFAVDRYRRDHEPPAAMPEPGAEACGPAV